MNVPLHAAVPTSYNTASQVTSVTYGSGDSDSFSFDPNTQLPTGYTITVGAKSQTATITQNANHTMRQLSITTRCSATKTKPVYLLMTSSSG